MGWCGLQVEGFAHAVEQALQDPSRQAAISTNPRFAKANRALAFELTSMLDETTSLYVNSVDKTDGAAMLVSLSRAVVASSSSHANALHERFTHPTPVTDKARLLHALKQWRSDYDELRVSKAAPSKASTLQALRAMVSQIPELQIPFGVLDMTRKDDIAALYKLVEDMASEWATLASDTRLTLAPSANTVGINVAAHMGNRQLANTGSDSRGVPCSFHV